MQEVGLVNYCVSSVQTQEILRCAGGGHIESAQVFLAVVR
jgi:hypothetical protein